MGEIEEAGGERFVDAGLEHGELVLVEFSLIVQVGLVDKDGRARVAERIMLCLIGHPLFLEFAANTIPSCGAVLVCRVGLALQARDAGGGTQSLDGVEPFTAVAADNEPASLGVTRGRFGHTEA
jgi:hypothetical protein